jgi:arylsulfatase A-like enzyme
VQLQYQQEEIEMAKTEKPNILVIWGDDIGISNLSCYSHGLMGYKTPNIDRIAKEGMMFTDCYGEQSCTAGRSSFITGQSVYRTGLSKVGIPGAPIGMSEKLVTIAACLKNQGYATGQFGKNHLGDLNHMLPTNHGFDEFFGNLYPPQRRRRAGNGETTRTRRISRTSVIRLDRAG